MTNKKTPTESHKPRSIRSDSQMPPKPKVSQNASQGPSEASLQNKIALLDKQQVKLLKDIENLRLEVAYYQYLWETTEDELLDMENESWWKFTLYRVKRWFKEIFEVEPS